jgi:hypothetical protein
VVLLEPFAEFLDTEAGADGEGAEVVGPRDAGSTFAPLRCDRCVMREILGSDEVGQAVVVLVGGLFHLLAQEMECGQDLNA